MVGNFDFLPAGVRCKGEPGRGSVERGRLRVGAVQLGEAETVLAPVAGRETAEDARALLEGAALELGVVSEGQLGVEVHPQEPRVQLEQGWGVAEENARLDLSVDLPGVEREERYDRLGPAQVHLLGLGPEHEPVGRRLQRPLALAKGGPLRTEGAVVGVGQRQAVFGGAIQ